MDDPTWNDLPSGGWIDVTVAEDGDVWVEIDSQDDRRAKIYMAPINAFEVASKLLEAALRGRRIESRAAVERARVKG